MISAFKGKLGLLFRYNMQQQLTFNLISRLRETTLHQHNMNPTLYVIYSHTPKATDATLMLL
jgi:hypothetical protein